MKIVLRDPPLPFLVMAIVMKVPMLKLDSPMGRISFRPDIEQKKPPKPDQWARAQSNPIQKAG